MSWGRVILGKPRLPDCWQSWHNSPVGWGSSMPMLNLKSGQRRKANANKPQRNLNWMYRTRTLPSPQVKLGPEDPTRPKIHRSLHEKNIKSWKEYWKPGPATFLVSTCSTQQTTREGRSGCKCHNHGSISCSQCKWLWAKALNAKVCSMSSGCRHLSNENWPRKASHHHQPQMRLPSTPHCSMGQASLCQVKGKRKGAWHTSKMHLKFQKLQFGDYSTSLHSTMWFISLDGLSTAQNLSHKRKAFFQMNFSAPSRRLPGYPVLLTMVLCVRDPCQVVFEAHIRCYWNYFSDVVALWALSETKQTRLILKVAVVLWHYVALCGAIWNQWNPCFFYMFFERCCGAMALCGAMWRYLKPKKHVF